MLFIEVLQIEIVSSLPSVQKLTIQYYALMMWRNPVPTADHTTMWLKILLSSDCYYRRSRSILHCCCPDLNRMLMEQLGRQYETMCHNFNTVPLSCPSPHDVYMNHTERYAVLQDDVCSEVTRQLLLVVMLLMNAATIPLYMLNSQIILSLKF